MKIRRAGSTLGTLPVSSYSTQATSSQTSAGGRSFWLPNAEHGGANDGPKPRIDSERDQVQALLVKKEWRSAGAQSVWAHGRKPDPRWPNWTLNTWRREGAGRRAKRETVTVSKQTFPRNWGGDLNPFSPG